MADNDDYMSSKATDDNIAELMWDRLQEGINANRRFRLKGMAGGDEMRYSSTKVVWDSDIYIYFTRESDGAWVYNKINTNPTTGITCGDNDLLYVVLNDTTATVLTVTASDYTSMLTDDTGRVLIIGGVSNGTWYGNVIGGYTDAQVEAVILAELAEGESIDAAIDALIATHATDDNAHHEVFEPGDEDAAIAVHAALTASHGVAQIANHGEIASQISTHTSDDNAHHEVLESLAGDSTPQLGGELDVNQKHINLNTTALADGKATGIIATFTAGTTLAFPNLVFIAADGDCELADADSSNSMPAIGMVLTAATVGNPVDVLLWGYVYYSTWSWTVTGAGETRLLYTSLTAGGMTQDPTGYTTGDQVQVVATVVEADYIIFNPSYVLVEVA